jgi:uncharacterized protein YndB with AHSA1/START domain
MELRFAVQTKVQKPANEVFDAVYNPKKLSEYFTNGGSDEPLDEGKTVLWRFNDQPQVVMTVPVKVHAMVKNKFIGFSWAASEGSYNPKTGSMPQPGGYDTRVEISFESLGANATLVRIVEGEWRLTEGGLQGSYANCQGWMNMCCCLKAFLEYDINLRKGAF